MSVGAASAAGGGSLEDVLPGMAVVDRDDSQLGEVVRTQPDETAPVEVPSQERVTATGGEPAPVQPQAVAPDGGARAGHVQIDSPDGTVYAAAAQVEGVVDGVVHLSVSRAELRDYLYPAAETGDPDMPADRPGGVMDTRAATPGAGEETTRRARG